MRRGICLAGVVVLAVCGLGAGPAVPGGPSESPFAAEPPRDGARVLDPRSLAEAERLFRAAEGYDAAGRTETAYVCYLILRCRYRETAFGARAAANAQQIVETFFFAPAIERKEWEFQDGRVMMWATLNPPVPPEFFQRLALAIPPTWLLPTPGADGGPGDPEREYRALLASAADGGIARSLLLGTPADVAEVIRAEDLDLFHLVGLPLSPSDCAGVLSIPEGREQDVQLFQWWVNFFR
jgi:hypothetical protein